MAALPMLALHSLALAWLLGEPAAEPEPAVASPEYTEAVAEVDRLNLAVNRDPDANHPALAAAVEKLTEFADELARDPKARELRTLAQLNVARALLRAGDEEAAGTLVDEAIRAAGDAEIPADNFGPKFGDFFDKRLEALREWGTGAIAVECTMPCRVLIDEREVADSGTAGLYFGNYRVWIGPEDPTSVEDPTPAQHRIEIDIDGEIEKLEYAPAPKIIEPEPVVEPPKVEPPPKRLLPRWAEITGLGVGAGLMILGGVLLGTDGNCVAGGGLDPMADAQQCPQLWESTVSGAVLLATGAALGIAGGVTLAIDEVRLNNYKGTQAVLTWTIRF
jgi:hypothetical protein